METRASTRDLCIAGLGVFLPETVSVAWAVAPLVAYAVSQPMARRRSALSRSDVAFLRSVAVKTWSCRGA